MCALGLTTTDGVVLVDSDCKSVMSSCSSQLQICAKATTPYNLMRKVKNTALSPVYKFRTYDYKLIDSAF